jgi:outer membrane murein-binding lipoprotein Lpp
MEWIQTAASATVVMSFIAGVISKIAISPLISVMKSLQGSVDKLSEDLKEEREVRVDMQIKMTEIEQRGKSNTHRLDEMDKRRKP